jgi:FAD/FMN-containing dehydrogenase
LLSNVSVPMLRGTITGEVVLPGAPDYEARRRVFAGDIDRRPLAIVKAAHVEDVIRTVEYARETGVPLAVRSGGHSPFGTGDGCVVLDLRALNNLEVDASGRTAWAQTGLTAGEYSVAVGAHGLATGFGDTGSVGIGGITLAGGIGYLVRKHGLTIDSVLGAEVVTAEGELLVIDAESHPDLFWAIRGGGGNFGVVTRVKFRLHAVDHVVGGMLMLPATVDTIVGVVDAAREAPDDLTIIANIMPAPPLPFVPEQARGELTILLLVCYAGEVERGTEVMAPFRALATPVVDMVRPMRYPELFPPDDPSYHPTAVGRTMFLDHVDRLVAETILDYLRQSDASMRVAQLRVLGGAMARVPSMATAFAHRDRRILANVASFYEGSEDRNKREEWTVEFANALNQGDAAAYVAFVGTEGDARVRAAYPPPTWQRLANVKRRYDPTNLFRMNHNIKPHGSAAL